MANTEQLITEHLDLWSSAVKAKSSAGRGSNKKLDLYGITKLRELILDLAVRGMLVPQDPEDEDIQRLKYRLISTKNELIKNKIIRKQKVSGETVDPKSIFQIPINWAWIRLGNTISLFGGFAYKSNSYVPSSNNQIIRLGNVKNNTLLLEQKPAYISEELADETSEYALSEGDILITMTGTKAKRDYAFTHLVQNSDLADRKLFLNQRVGSIKAVIPEIAPIINLFLKSNYLLDLIFITATGTANQANIGSSSLLDLPFPLPPLSEQYRIVAKVDELMALCDQLEQEQESNLETHETLVSTLLNALTSSSADTAQFADAWQRIQSNFDILFNTENSVDQLKQTILQLAVMGKLVQQDPVDEPAQSLINKIREQEAHQGTSKKTNRKKSKANLHGKELFFNIPETWKWITLDEITGLITKGSSPKWQGIDYVSEEDGILFITSENVGNYTLRKMNDLKFVEGRFNQIEPRSILKKGDILMNLVGASIGRTALFSLDSVANINQAVALIRLANPHDCTIPNYILHYLNSPAAIEYMLGSRVTNAQPNISLTDANNFPIPLPPLAEQHRIVAKVDELMALCDQLKVSLASAQKTQLNLADSFVEQAIK